ncbi:MAG: SPOR domain-containing protein [Alphaproteobacteria bacterium]|nr:SPOR domain-containing protein [Alphaproteobacteria bacterium]
MRGSGLAWTVVVASVLLCGPAHAVPAPVPAETVVKAPDWRLGSTWYYSDGYGLKVSANSGGVTTFDRLDAPGQWFSRQGFLRKDLVSGTATRNSIYRTMPDQAGASLSAATPLTFQREYLANGQLVVHASSWTVEGRETITVPAGTFDCWIIVWRTRSLRSDWTGFERWWYSPQAQNYVRLEYKYGNSDEGSRVLMRYSLGQEIAAAPPAAPQVQTAAPQVQAEPVKAPELAAVVPAPPPPVEREAMPAPAPPPSPPAAPDRTEAAEAPPAAAKAESATVNAPEVAAVTPSLPTPVEREPMPAVAPPPPLPAVPAKTETAESARATAAEVVREDKPAPPVAEPAVPAKAKGPAGTMAAAPPAQRPAVLPAVKAAAKPAPEKAAAAAPAGDAAMPWRVQLASSKDEAALKAELEKLRAAEKARFKDVPSGIAAAEIEGRGTFYRAWVGAFPTATQATALCDSFKSAGHECAVVRYAGDGKKLASR